MKKFYTFIFASVVLSGAASAQITLFSQDFESTVTNMINTGGVGSAIPDGSSPCGLFGRGNTTNMNSTNIDFFAAMNPTNFLAGNPETPCGGFYAASVDTDTLDFSGMDSVYIQLKYFRTSTLGWGPAPINVSVKSSTGTHNFSSSDYSLSNQWITQGNWVPVGSLGGWAVVSIFAEFGEGIAFDDLVVTGYPSAVTGIEANEDKIQLYPSPASNSISINPKGKGTVSIISVAGVAMSADYEGETTLDISDLQAGLYIAHFISENGDGFTTRFIKE